MQTFIDLIQIAKDLINVNTKRKRIYEALISTLKNHPALNQSIDDVFFDAIKNELTRAETLVRITPLISSIQGHISPPDFQSVITDVWIYEQGRSVFAGKTIDLNDKKYIIARRRGQDGGFEISPISIDPIQSDSMTDADTALLNVEAINDIAERTDTTVQRAENSEKIAEKTLYPFVQKWAQANEFEKCEIMGSYAIRPRWENPDLIEIYCSYNKHTMNIVYEITSFEVKLKISPAAIWQAAHYKKFSHYVFIAFAMTEEEVREEKRYLELAIEHGLGILVRENKSDDISDMQFRLMHYPTLNTPTDSEINSIVSDVSQKYKNIQEYISEKLRQKKIDIFSEIKFQITGA